MCVPESQREQVGRGDHSCPEPRFRGTETGRREGTVDRKQEGGHGLHMPWMVLLDAHRLPPRGCGAVPIPAYKSSSSLTRTEERCREGTGGELTHFTCRVSLGLSSHRSSRPLQIPPPHLPPCQLTVGGAVWERRVTWRPPCEQALTV